MDIIYNDKGKYEILVQKKFRYDIPAYTGLFRALFVGEFSRHHSMSHILSSSVVGLTYIQ
jgi:hypothetical protein